MDSPAPRGFPAGCGWEVGPLRRMLAHMPPPSRLVPLLLALAAGALAWLAFTPVVKGELHFEVDEAEYLAMGLFTVEQDQGLADATRGGLVPADDPNTWRGGIHEVTYGFQSPGLPKFVFGGIVRATLPEGTLVLPWVFPRFTPESTGGFAPRSIRLSAREALKPALAPAREVPRMLLALAAGLLAFGAARIAQGFSTRLVEPVVAATVAGFGFVTSGAVQAAANHVRPGAFPVVFMALGWAVFLWAVRSRAGTGVRLFGAAIGFGLALGLATAGKLNGAVFAAAIPFLVMPLGGPRASRVVAMAGAWLIGFAVFVLFAPGLWHDTLGGIEQILRGWRGDFAFQSERYGDEVRVSAGRLDGLGLALRAMCGEAGPGGGFAPYLGVLFTVLGALGLAGFALGGRVFGRGEGAPPTPNRAVDHGAFWFCILLVVGSGLLVPMDRTRYYLPLVWPLALAAGVFVARIGSLVGPHEREPS